MTEWWFYLVAIPTAALLANGLPHFINGASGKGFPSPFSGGPGTEDEPWRNVLWGSSNLIIGGLLLWLIRDGLTNLVLVAELVVIAVAYTTLLGHVFGHPERFGRNRRR